MMCKNAVIWFVSIFINLNILLPANALIFQVNNSCNSASNSLNIPRFGKVDDGYYRGSQPKDEDFQKIAKLGIKTVIDLRLRSSEKARRQKELVNSYGMNYENIPLNPFIPPTNKQIESFFNIINNSKNLPVFVHCWHGEDRTGIMTALYRVKYYNWDYEKAYAEMKAYGHHSIIFARQKYFLRDYVNRLN